MIFKKETNAFEYLIVGLGNPGLQYENTRHNAGFMALDYIAEKSGAQLSKRKFDALFGEGTVAGKRVLLVKPQTYMNLSGKAVSGLSSFYKIPSDRIIILFDDISLDVGKLRLRRKGSDGGHNGMNIIELLGTDDIMRIKIGVGQKPHPDYDLKDWVLSKIPQDKQAAFTEALERAAAAVEETLKKGIDSAMNKYNS